jgi:4-aminobutyrate aminotransferase
LRIIQEDNLMAHAVEVGNHIQSRFREAQGKLPIIGDVRGKGLMVGVELINADGSPAGGAVKAVIKDVGTRGIVLTKCGASTLRFAPPLIIAREQAGEGVDIILETLAHHQW